MYSLIVFFSYCQNTELEGLSLSHDKFSVPFTIRSWHCKHTKILLTISLAVRSIKLQTLTFLEDTDQFWNLTNTLLCLHFIVISEYWKMYLSYHPKAMALDRKTVFVCLCFPTWITLGCMKVSWTLLMWFQWFNMDKLVSYFLYFKRNVCMGAECCWSNLKVSVELPHFLSLF